MVQDDRFTTEKRAVSTAGKIGVSLVRSSGFLKRIKGLKTEDELIHNKALYGVGGTNPNLTPVRGASYDMSLYFGNKAKSIPRGTTEVLQAVRDGYNVDQLDVVTGLPPADINAALRYLVKKKLITREEATSWVG